MKHTLYSNYYGWISDDDLKMSILDCDIVDNEDNKTFIDKFLGMFGLLENNAFLKVFGAMFGWLPSEFSSVIMSALVICAGVGVYKLFKK